MPPPPPVISPPPPPRRVPAAELVERLNGRFKNGRPTSALVTAGVLVRQFDKLDDKDRPWRPCPQTGPDNWCKGLADRWASSVVNRNARHLYMVDRGGLVVSPSVELFCACPEDCNSQAKLCDPLGGDGSSCIPGCYPMGQQCPDLDRTYECSFPPTHLRDALMAQQARHDYRDRNNEMVVDLRSMSSNLPNSIQAFFLLSTSTDEGYVRAARKTFLLDYGLTEDSGPPLLLLSFEGGSISGDAPFALA